MGWILEKNTPGNICLLKKKINVKLNAVYGEYLGIRKLTARWVLSYSAPDQKLI